MSWESTLEISKWRHRARAAEAEVAQGCLLLRAWTLTAYPTKCLGEKTADLLDETYRFIDDDPEAS